MCIRDSPKGSGTSLRTMFCEGRGLNCSYAVYQDASGNAEDKTIAFGIGIGAGYLFKTTFQREATSDLTGERGSLMGAIEGLLEAQYDVLRENGHSPSEAFNETVEELTQSLGPLFGSKGMDWMYANCSTTAQRGALDWAPRFREAIKPVMEWLYYSVKTGNCLLYTSMARLVCRICKDGRREGDTACNTSYRGSFTYGRSGECSGCSY